MTQHYSRKSNLFSPGCGTNRKFVRAYERRLSILNFCMYAMAGGRTKEKIKRTLFISFALVSFFFLGVNAHRLPITERQR